MIELDIFHDRYEGLILAEVEFDSVEESKLFEKNRHGFLEDVSGKVDYTNSYLAQKVIFYLSISFLRLIMLSDKKRRRL